MSVNILLIFRILMIVIFLALSFFVYLKDRKSLLNKAYSLVIFTGFIWSFTVLMADIDLDRALLWTQLSVLGPIFIPPSFLLFSIIFPYKSVLLSKIKIVVFFIPSLILTSFVFSKFNVERVWLEKWGTDYKPGILYVFVFLLFAIYISYSVVLFLKKYRKLKGLERLQILYVLLAIISAVITGFVFNLVLPLFVSGQSSTYGPSLSSFIFFAFTTYAILRYRLMDIRVIIRRSAVFTVLVSLITAIYALIAYVITLFFQDLIGAQSVILNGIVTAVLVAIGFEPLKKGLSQITDTFLFKAEYKPQEVLAEFADKLSSTLNLDELTQFLVKKTGEVFKCATVSLFLFNAESKIYEEEASWGKRGANSLTKIDQKLFAKIFSYLRQLGREKDIIVREEIKKLNEQAKSQALDLLIKQLDEQEVNLVVPFFVKEEMVGILFLGDKKSGDVYSQQDLNVLGIIAGQSAVSIQNAGLFEEERKNTIILQNEVDKATARLKVINKELKEIDKDKSAFVSIVSHQLRTPLTSIYGFISMIIKGDYKDFSEKLKSPLEKMEISTKRVISLVEDLLNIDKIESGKMEYVFKYADLKNIIAGVCSELEIIAKMKNLQFSCVMPQEDLPQVIMDEKKIREVIMNLADNAIKYTEHGFVKLLLEKKGNDLIYSVSDSGRGIDKKDINKLFKKYSRVQGGKQSGTGLGLFIAKNVVTKHNGKLWAESKGEGSGSTFYLLLPVKNPALEQEMSRQKTEIKQIGGFEPDTIWQGVE